MIKKQIKNKVTTNANTNRNNINIVYIDRMQFKRMIV